MVKIRYLMNLKLEEVFKTVGDATGSTRLTPPIN